MVAAGLQGGASEAMTVAASLMRGFSCRLSRRPISVAASFAIRALVIDESRKCLATNKAVAMAS